MTAVHTTDHLAKAKAEATFKRKEQQARDGAIAMTEYLAEQKAVRAKTERLRALRLAKEATEATEANADKKKTARRA
jgi:hypothetical protein